LLLIFTDVLAIGVPRGNDEFDRTGDGVEDSGLASIVGGDLGDNFVLNSLSTTLEAQCTVLSFLGLIVAVSGPDGECALILPPDCSGHCNAF
jgi:hypothetical protein